MSDLEPPPDELKELFAAERVLPAVDATARAATRARLAASVGSAPLGQAAAGTALGGAAKALATIALVVAVGAGGMVVATHVSSGPRATTPAPPRSVQPASPAVEHVQVAAREVTPPPPVARAVAMPAPNLPSEAELLRRAWTALSDGQAELARQLADQDARLHRDGALGEERDALEILALARLERMDEARAAAAQFIQRYPTSVHRARIERTISNEEKP